MSSDYSIKRAVAVRFLQSDEVRRVIAEGTEAVAARANAMCGRDRMGNRPFEAGVFKTSTAWHGYVTTATPHGARAQAKSKVLRRALKS